MQDVIMKKELRKSYSKEKELSQRPLKLGERMASLKEVAEMDKTKVESRKKERYEKLKVVIYRTLQNQKQLIKRNLPIGV
jgi:hypothetical protein